MSAGDVQLGYADIADAQAISLLSRDFIEHGLGWAYRPERIERYVRDPDAVVLVARARRNVAGFAIMQFGQMSGQMSGPMSGQMSAPMSGQVSGQADSQRIVDERAHLVLMAVAPPFRRQGVGRRLLGWLVASAQVAGVMSIHVELRAQNRAAHALYQSLGFAETLRLPGYYRGRETAVRMLRLLRTTSMA